MRIIVRTRRLRLGSGRDTFLPVSYVHEETDVGAGDFSLTYKEKNVIYVYRLAYLYIVKYRLWAGKTLLFGIHVRNSSKKCIIRNMYTV